MASGRPGLTDTWYLAFLVTVDDPLCLWMGSGWPVGLRRLLRRANFISAPCDWGQAPSGKSSGWDQVGEIRTAYRFSLGKQAQYPTELGWKVNLTKNTSSKYVYQV